MRIGGFATWRRTARISRRFHGGVRRSLSQPAYWGMNEVAREMTVKPLTAVLVRPKRMSDLPSLHRELNVAAETQAVLPSGVLLTIFNMMAVAEDVLKMILAIVGVIVLLYVFVSMYSATMERRREIATMRALGARRATVLGIVLVESAALSTVGAVGGIVGGHAVAYLAGSLLGPSGLVTNPFVFNLFEPAVVAG